MAQVIMIGCDLHDRNMLLRYAVGTSVPQQLAYGNDASGRRRMIAWFNRLAQKHGCDRIVFAYEASGLGHGLSDELHDKGIECYVLSPTHLPKTPKSARLKTDVRDAQMLLEQVRGFILAGNDLPVVWTPPQRLRDDRELVRARIDVADEITRVKLKITTLFKAREIKVVGPTKRKWTKAYIAHIRKHVIPALELTVGTKLKLLLDRFDMYRKEQAELDKALTALSKEKRYQVACTTLRKLPGVGLLVAMTFLTEMGDLFRFENRRQVAAYMGLCPSSKESGVKNDRKGRITRQGSARLRKMLCQAAWVSVVRDETAAAEYYRIKQNQPHRSKKALVAMMRKLGIKMWHRGLACGVSTELEGRGRPNFQESSELRSSSIRGTAPPRHHHASL